MSGLISRCLIPSILLLAACGPSPEKQAEIAERKRVECLDKFCNGDVAPQTVLDEEAIKLNGEIFIAPRPYVMGISNLAFYWPSKTPIAGRADRQPFPELDQDVTDAAITVFLHRDQTSPGGASTTYKRMLAAAEVKGQLIKKTTLRSGLEAWYIDDRESGRGLRTWFVATELREPNGDYPALACREEVRDGVCTGGFLWQSGISLDFRFSSKHARDWPEIYQEIIRILQLLRKV